MDRTQPLLAPLYQSPQGLYFLDEGQTVRVLLHLPPGKFCQGLTEITEIIVIQKLGTEPFLYKYLNLAIVVINLYQKGTKSST